MAKHPPSSPERSKVRILFVEADVASGDMQQLTQALTAAIRPAPQIVRQQIVASAATLAAEPIIDVEPIDAETVEENGARHTGGKPPARVRTYRKPTPVDMDMKAGGKPFTDFAAEKKPESHRWRYLVAAAWLDEYAQLKTINIDHVYTCYKAAGWTFDITDPTQVFRDLKADALGATKQGDFTINHLGLAEVEKMNKES